MESYQALKKYVHSPQMLNKLKEMGEVMVFEKNQVLLNERLHPQHPDCNFGHGKSDAKRFGDARVILVLHSAGRNMHHVVFGWIT